MPRTAAGRLLLVVGLCGPILAWSASGTATATTESRPAVPPLDRATSVVVAPPAAVPARAVALGPSRASQAIDADVVLAPRHPALLATLAAAVSTPGSPLRGSYRTPGELVREFSPSLSEVSTVEAWLRDLGLRVGSVSADRLSVSVSGTAVSFSRAMGTRFEDYRLPDGEVTYASSTAARLPMPLGADVTTVVGLSDLPAARPLLAPTSASTRSRPAESTSEITTRTVALRTATGAGPQPCAAAAAEQSAGGHTADQLASYYRMNGLYAKGDFGSGSTVGIVEFERVLPSDIAGYESCYGIATPVRYVAVDGGARGFSGGSGEAALDIEDVAGLAPAAHVLVYQAPNTNRGVFDEFQRIVDHPSADVVTNSWGECEPALGSSAAAARRVAQAESTLFEYGAAEGQSWLSAAGDEGSTDCFGDLNLPVSTQESLSVDDPGSQPYMTSVGGTVLHPEIHREAAWNGGGVATGGGISAVWPMPAYQLAAPPALGVVGVHSSPLPCDSSTGYCREVPDVTADGDPSTGYVILYEGGWMTIGGTSGAAPLWAAVIALVDASPRCGGRDVGFLDPTLYALAGSRRYTAVLNDVTVGNNDDRASGYTGGLYRAGAGYDMASGLGSPNVTSPQGGLASGLCVMARRVRPGINSISPDSGAATGGNRVTLYGYGFTGVTGVEFGGVPASFRVGQDWTGAPTWISATVPPGSGRVRVTVLTSRGSSVRTLGDMYTYRS
jgi:subtilase family serine protease